jgi:hypothetical protein
MLREWISRLAAGSGHLALDILKHWRFVFVAVVIILIFDYLESFVPERNCRMEVPSYSPSDIRTLPAPNPWENSFTE